MCGATLSLSLFGRFSAVRLVLTGAVAWSCGVAHAQYKLPLISDVDVQPLLVQVQRVREAMDYLGQPLSEQAQALLDKATKAEDRQARKLIQKALDPYCLFGVQINPESRVKVARGAAPPRAMQDGWTLFLVKVDNQAGVTAELKVDSPQAKKLAGAKQEDVRDLWLELDMFNGRPMARDLSGLPLEYRVIQIYSRDGGQRAAVFSFNVGQGTQDIGFRNDVTVTFNCERSVPVTLRVRDENGESSTAAFEIRDARGRVYPPQSKRLAPDFSFHPQVYRHDGETVDLPPGNYDVRITRGPEYFPQQTTWLVGKNPIEFTADLQRWVDPSAFGWWSGDHHIHAAGCAHYDQPSEGVHAPAMFRHCRGEDLKIGANLTWGPCFDYQKRFFTGQIDKVSQYPYLLRYDVEVSGFGSHKSGHLCLLRLKQQIPPGGESTDHWPTLCLNTLRWAKKQGAVCGPAHSGWGLSLTTDDLPSYEIPPFDGIGACEYIVDVTHKVEGPDGSLVPAVDFISTVDTPYVWELNVWYHTLNCGYRTRISGETDFPCIYGERVGLGRAYAKLEGRLEYDGWCEAIRQGAAYVSDGRSHLIDFRVDDVSLGEESELRLNAPQSVEVSAQVAALLAEQPEGDIAERPYSKQPYWHIERARLHGTQLSEVQQGIDRLETELVNQVEKDLAGKQVDIERNLLAHDKPPVATPWKFAGPFPCPKGGQDRAERIEQAHQQRFGPESHAMAPEEDEELDWREYDWADGKVNDMPLGEDEVGYLYRTLTADDATELELELGADHAVRVWLNGDELLERSHSSPERSNDARESVWLKPGTNVLLVKITHGKGKADFFFQSSHIGIPADVRAAMIKPLEDRTGEEHKLARLYYGSSAPAYAEFQRKIDDLRQSHSRQVKVELVVNGYPVDSKVIEADGALRPVTFSTKLEQSSWVAMRILPSSHTNPVFVTIGDKPIRASRRSAEWCLKGVEQCRQQKERFIDEDELNDFHNAYDHANDAYRQILSECDTE